MTSFSSAFLQAFSPLEGHMNPSRMRMTAALRAARIGILPEWYLTLSLLGMAGGAMVGGIAAAIYLAATSPPDAITSAVLVVGGAIVTGAVVRLCFLVYPRVLASSRARLIDAEFPSVVMLCYALARGGVDAMNIFRAVSEERDTYGEISREFGIVVREVEWMGVDLNAALQLAAKSTPSRTLSAFFEGLVTILNSGADPRDFFKRQAAMQLASAEANMEKEIDQAGLLAEAYVSSLLVLPLLLIVVLSVLAAVRTLDSAFIPLIVFVGIPGGTIAYIVLLETMLPPERLSIPPSSRPPLLDFGMETTYGDAPQEPLAKRPSLGALHAQLKHQIAQGGEEATRARRLQRVLILEWLRLQVMGAWTDFVDAALESPLRALRLSAPIALVVLAVGGALVFLEGGSGSKPAILGTTVLAVSLLLAFLPVGVLHELRVRRARGVDGALPETLSKLSGFNERGVSLLRSFQILGQTGKGPLTAEMKALDRDVSWTGNLRGALRRMRDRVRTHRMMKVGVVFERGTAATGNLKEVLEIAAGEATTAERQRTRRRHAMMTYALVVYVVFAVFLYVVYTLTGLFYGNEGFSTLASTRSGGSAQATAAREQAELMFFHAVLIQGACCGMVAGKLGEGHVLSGIKHAGILMLLAWLIFQFGVFG